jgi:DNA modification methylase
MQPMAIEPMPVAALYPYPGNPRTHSKRQVRQIAESIQRFGFTNPVLIGEDGEIIAGHGRVEAAKLLGLESVPTVRLAHLDAAQRRAYVLADNKLALNAGWDRDLLAIELQGLINLEFDIELTGFSAAEIDIVLDEAHEGSTDGPAEPEDQVLFTVEDPASAVTRSGDLWCLGRHRMICGDARDRAVFDKLMGDERADLIFTDPPYNVPIDGHVTGLGRIRHREFAMGVGEMSAEAFAGFLQRTLGNAAKASRSGAIAFVCMDWRHMGELLEAGQAIFSELKNVCVWNKTNGGMGTFYRSKHELVFVFKIGSAAHTNTFGLGDSGRYRTNVWDFAGVNTMRAGRSEDLAMHPTVKPVALVAEAIKDCSRRGEIVLDPFGGSGTTLMAAQKTGRLARLIECDPAYCDTILRRFERVIGQQATHAASAMSFEDVSQERAAQPGTSEEQLP